MPVAARALGVRSLTRTRRYPLEPALEYLGVVWTMHRTRWRSLNKPEELLEPDGAVRALAELAGFAPRSIHRWRHAGLTELVADRVAIALGAHPAVIWPEWFAPELLEELAGELELEVPA